MVANHAVWFPYLPVHTHTLKHSPRVWNAPSSKQKGSKKPVPLNLNYFSQLLPRSRSPFENWDNARWIGHPPPNGTWAPMNRALQSHASLWETFTAIQSCTPYNVPEPRDLFTAACSPKTQNSQFCSYKALVKKKRGAAVDQLFDGFHPKPFQSSEV